MINRTIYKFLIFTQLKIKEIWSVLIVAIPIIFAVALFSLILLLCPLVEQIIAAILLLAFGLFCLFIIWIIFDEIILEWLRDNWREAELITEVEYDGS